MTARKAAKDTSRPTVPPSTATTPASVVETCSTTENSMLICGAILDMATLLRSAGAAAGANASTAAARKATAVTAAATCGRA